MKEEKKDEVKQEEVVVPQAADENTQKLAKEYEDLRNKYLRVCADYDNARKRWERERDDLLKYGAVTLLRDLLTVVDELEQALKMAREHKSDAEILKGLDLMHKNFVNLLKKNGLEVIEAKGKRFDPHFHEIMGMQDITEGEDQSILEEIQKGYLCEGKVLRTSKVVVGVKKEKEILEEGNS
jgi:molecular chaperone GrpE